MKSSRRTKYMVMLLILWLGYSFGGLWWLAWRDGLPASFCITPPNLTKKGA